MHTYKLEVPITLDGREVTELNIRRPTWRDAKASDAIREEDKKTEFMISALAEISPEDVQGIDLADIGGISAVIEYYSTPKFKRGELELPT